MCFLIGFIDPSTISTFSACGFLFPPICVLVFLHTCLRLKWFCAGQASFPVSMGSSAVLLSCRSPHLLHRRARAQELPASEAPPSENRPQGQKGEVGRKHL